MSGISVSQVAYYLAIIGGILLIIFSLLSLIGFNRLSYLHFSFYAFSYDWIVPLICGVIAIIGAKSANTLVWAIVLIVLGIVGGGLGGLIVVLGGLVGLITVLTKKT